jgi:hypothetical protein
MDPMLRVIIDAEIHDDVRLFAVANLGQRMRQAIEMIQGSRSRGVRNL